MNTPVNKSDCCGCGACSQICPTGALTMRKGDGGFLYPEIDQSACVNCSLCHKVCPERHPKKENLPLGVYAARIDDENILSSSSSGGMFTALAMPVIENGGVVFGAEYQDGYRSVQHSWCEKKEDLDRFRRSKYLQSNTGKCYAIARKFLDEGREVMYSGTPCQIAGLKTFLGKEYPGLLTVSLICHGVPGPDVWKRYLQTLTGEAKVESVMFRDNRYSWKNCHFSVKDESTEHFMKFRDSSYIRGFLGALYTRESCSSCSFRSMRSGSDIVIGDYWGVWKYNPEMFDDKGVSVLLTGSTKGMDFLSRRTSLRLTPLEYGHVLKYNNALENSTPAHAMREEFMKRYQTEDFDTLVDSLTRE